MLNLGCGGRYHRDWVNLDCAPQSRDVIRHDLRERLPFPDEHFEVVYHSHVLEHVARHFAPQLLEECRRVLRPAGILRVVVPDLEKIARLYLKYLEASLAGEPGASERYDWITLELMDQMVRERSGGEMAAYWKQNPMPAEDFVIERFGQEVRQALADLRTETEQRKSQSPRANLPAPSCKEIGRFRESGEVHKWMYDRYSLGNILEKTGFKDVRVCAAHESGIADFGRFGLDLSDDGSPRKPDSLFMEARKPEGQQR